MAEIPIEISIVVPVYNSTVTIHELISRIRNVMDPTSLRYEMILTNDSSTDNSWEVIKAECQSDKRIIGLCLTENCGQWCSSLAGISMAGGKYIITMDDDLEYDPADIMELYRAIASGPYSVVFGMAQDKYTIQGKSRQLSKVRNSMLNLIWTKPPTDSFKIFKREVVFENKIFLVKEPFEVYIMHNLKTKYWGYIQVRFNKRHAGNSNHTLKKKMQVFFLFSSFISTHPILKITTLAGIILLAVFMKNVLFRIYIDSTVFQLIYWFAMVLIGGMILYYLIGILYRPNPAKLYSITEAVNSRSGELK